MGPLREGVQHTEALKARLAPFNDIPIVFTSVLNKQRILEVLNAAAHVAENMGRRIPTSELNDAMLPEIENYPPPAWKGKYVKIKYVTQLPTRTPQFAFFCNLPQWVKDPYKRFLENKLRQHFDFTGCPIQVYTVKKTKDACVQWIRDWFEENGPGCNAVIGISGGKDSSVVAGLCVEALGVDRVIGVTMPNGVQPDIDDSIRLINHLGIKRYDVNIGAAYDALMAEVELKLGHEASAQTRINMAPRLRMTALYAVSQSNNGRVANTCNLSEDWVGYSTRYGDAAGDFSPLGGLTSAPVSARTRTRRRSSTAST